jgi:transcriptional regulator GlxA family with amidase domain
MKTRMIGIYIYDEVEVLDFAGPFEVFSTAARLYARQHPKDEPLFKVSLIADAYRTVLARGGFRVEPHFELSDHPPLDVLLVPGGVVTAELEREEVIAWITEQDAHSELTVSVCTGAFLLAKAGLLSGQRVTTHREDIADLRTMFPDLTVESGIRWIDNGKWVTSAGISAGIDMSLHLVSRLVGEELAKSTARQMEFDWNRNA